MLTPELYEEHRNSIMELTRSACLTYHQDGWLGCFCRLVPPELTDTKTYRIEVEHVPECEIMLDYDTESSDEGVANTVLTLTMRALKNAGRFIFLDDSAWKESVGETQILLAHGGLLCYLADDSTVCIRDTNGCEMVRWTDSEMEEDPLEVIGAIFGTATIRDKDVVHRLGLSSVNDGLWV